jgi:hypothetical protein
MPDDTVLRILRDDGQLYDDAAARVVATMLYPKDETPREQLVAYSGERALHLANIQIPSDLTAKTHFGPSENEFTQDAAQSLKSGGRLAGQLLVLLRQLDVYRPEDASVRKAIDLMERLLIKSKRACIAGPSPGGSTIRKAWSKFKSVCHLWAAYRIFEHDENLLSNKHLPEFLAASEWMRAFAESHIPPPKTVKSRPLAEEGELWKAPDQLQLDCIEFQVPPLSHEELRLLDKYTAEKRKRS